MLRIACVTIIMALSLAPALAQVPQGFADEQEHCRYLVEGTVARSIEMPAYCDPRPSSKNVDLFWNLGLLSVVLTAGVVWVLDRRKRA
jgi:hypothetical protein